MKKLRLFITAKNFWVVAIVFFLVGTAAGYLAVRMTIPYGKSLGGQLRAPSVEYPLVSQLIACLSPDKDYFEEYASLRNELVSFINREVSQGHADKVSVYFRDLTTGHWTGVNENNAYFPASLLKVPVMMAYFKQAATNPAVLGERLKYVVSASTGKNDATSATQLKSGQYYTVMELIDAMIIKSDNAALDALVNSVNNKLLSQIFADLEIDSPESVQETDAYAISVRKYSLLFRALYNATILNPVMSEKALDLLSRVEFKDGLVAALPKDLVVAHKYASHTSDPIGIELHDAGIVYYNGHPYFIGVMTKGKDITNLAVAISHISQVVYQFVSGE